MCLFNGILSVSNKIYGFEVVLLIFCKIKSSKKIKGEVLLKSHR